MNRKTFLQTLLGLPALVGLAKTVKAEPRSFDPSGPVGFKLRNIPQRNIIYGPRRSGKTRAAAITAVEEFNRGKSVLYAAPNQEQIGRFWDEVNRVLAPRTSDDGLIIAKLTEAAYFGRNVDLVILDEFQEVDFHVWSEVYAPMLLDNNGDALLIYQGEPFVGGVFVGPPGQWAMIRMGHKGEKWHIDYEGPSGPRNCWRMSLNRKAQGE